MSLYLFLSSEDCPAVASNTNNNFVIYLTDSLDLTDSSYLCSLKEIHFHNNVSKERIYIFCDIIDFRLVKKLFHPILRSTVSSHRFINPLQFKLSSFRISLYCYKDRQFVKTNLDGVTELVLALDKQ